MKDNAQKDILLLVLAGLVLVLVNMAVLMGIWNGRIAPADNFVLWGAFAVLNVCSLLWAVSLLGLQPMVVAVSYTAGGLMAYQGVRLLPEVNVAEIATAGATYGAFGALMVGNATTKVRMAFFTKRQVPFVFIIVALLLMGGLLNSQVSNAGWNVIANAIIFPFLFCGVIVGLIWMVLTRFRARQALVEETTEQVIDAEEPVVNTTADDEEVAQLMFSVPESAASAESMEETVLAHDPQPVAEDVSGTPVSEEVSPMSDPAVAENDFSDNFFPLEIDKDEDALPLEENTNLMGVAAMVAESAPEPVAEAEPIAEVAPTVEAEPVEEDVVFRSEGPSIPASNPEPVDEPEKEDLEEEGKANSEDWLNSHLDLLNKLN